MPATKTFQDNAVCALRVANGTSTTKIRELEEGYQGPYAITNDQLLSLQNEHTKLLERFNRQLEMLEEAV